MTLLSRGAISIVQEPGAVAGAAYRAKITLTVGVALRSYGLLRKAGTQNPSTPEEHFPVELHRLVRASIELCDV